MVPGRRLSSWSFPLPPRRAPRSRPPVVDARTSGYPVGTGLQTLLITAALVDSDDAVEVQVLGAGADRGARRGIHGWESMAAKDIAMKRSPSEHGVGCRNDAAILRMIHCCNTRSRAVQYGATFKGTHALESRVLRRVGNILF